MAKKVLVPIADGSEEIEAVCIIDTLRRAGAEVTVASVDKLQVTASRGVKLVADALIADCAGQTYDCIALPGGMPGAEHLRDSAELIEMLKKQKQAGRLYAAICASPAVVLQHHGLMEKVRATCFPGLQKQAGPGLCLQRAGRGRRQLRHQPGPGHRDRVCAEAGRVALRPG